MAWNFMGTIAAMIGCGGDNLSSFLWAGEAVPGGGQTSAACVHQQNAEGRALRS